jgi:ABC-type glycerol-3-phosphate transport system substrate-binding protein
LDKTPLTTGRASEAQEGGDQHAPFRKDTVGHAEDVEVLHWWTSGGEAAALNVLKEDLAGKGIGWVDMPVAGGGGEAAMTALRARVTAGDPPTAVQMLGFDIQDWAAEGALGNLDSVAAAEGWDAVVPGALQASRNTTATGSPRRSTCIRPTGSGSARPRWTPPAARRPRPGTSWSPCWTR